MPASEPSVADYALLSDCQGAALVHRDGSVDWWCAPRFDSRASLGRLLDADAGHFAIRPAGPFSSERRYLEDTLVLQTTFDAPGGRLGLTDALAFGTGTRGHEIGGEVPHALVRVAECLDGDVEVELEFAPRPEYGLVVPEIVRMEGGVRTLRGPDGLFLRATVGLELDGSRACARFTLRAGEAAGFVVHARRGLDPDEPPALDPHETLRDTIEGWRSWASTHSYDGAYAAEVRRAAIVLQALTYQPTGALVAAPTTSLPEIPGGDANWDYRYAWLRDAAMTMRALWISSCPDETDRYFEWMAAAAGACRHDDHIQIMFGIEGERNLAEHELDHLDGFGGARPVRVGNAAWKQRQLDVYGEVLDAAFLLRDELGELDPLVGGFVCSLADRAAEEWRRPDSGLWEGREGERHYVPSKVLCWVALDRAVQLAPQLGEHARPEEWARARDEVREAVLRDGWNEEAGAYTGAFGSDHLDAGVLLMPLYGFLPADDERFARTLARVEEELAEGPLVRRWTESDEGAFLMCSFWLADCHARAGRVEKAREIFEGAAAYANDLGLLAEMVWPETGTPVGNFPQLLSHVGLVNAAWSITQAERGAAQEPAAA